MLSEQEVIALRDLHASDEDSVRRILDTSEYVHYHFDLSQLPRLLERYPAVGAFSVPEGPLGRVAGGSLQAFLLVNWLVPPSAWLGGFGVTWSQGERFEAYLDPLLGHLEQRVAARGAQSLYYSGGDIDNDWLGDSLSKRGFVLSSLLRSYDKVDFSIPSEGNAQVRIRPFVSNDVPGLLAIEQQCFATLWQRDAADFLEVAATYPYFVVAEDEQGIVGYQFNAVDSITGYLVRIAVHPRAWGTGVGTRLMAEAVRYFQRRHVWKIVLNSEEENHRAHALYEWFGFRLIEPRGFVLSRQVSPDGA
ncbi:MAG TPA: GNAT family N-acetyltransferase [Ktedonobacterales bacterium]|nr:GNAT family N-acetyltransferase [Ktedonobacterales bacterium]